MFAYVVIKNQSKNDKIINIFANKEDAFLSAEQEYKTSDRLVKAVKLACKKRNAWEDKNPDPSYKFNDGEYSDEEEERISKAHEQWLKERAFIAEKSFIINKTLNDNDREILFERAMPYMRIALGGEPHEFCESSEDKNVEFIAYQKTYTKKWSLCGYNAAMFRVEEHKMTNNGQ